MSHVKYVRDDRLQLGEAAPPGCGTRGGFCSIRTPRPFHCREGICGSCAMNINGQNTLACLCKVRPASRTAPRPAEPPSLPSRLLPAPRALSLRRRTNRRASSRHRWTRTCRSRSSPLSRTCSSSGCAEPPPSPPPSTPLPLPSLRPAASSPPPPKLAAPPYPQDLVVDMANFYAQYKSIKPFLQFDPPPCAAPIQSFPPRRRPAPGASSQRRRREGAATLSPQPCLTRPPALPSPAGA